MIYYFYNEYNLGDSIVNIIFFNSIQDFLVRNCIHVYYYSQPGFLDALREFVLCPNVYLFSINQKPNHAFQLSIENAKVGETYSQAKERNNNRVCVDIYYKVFFNNVMRKHNIPLKFNTFFYSDPDLIKRYESLPAIYKNLDILVLNNDTENKQHLQLLDSNYRVATVCKVDKSILSTNEEKLSIKTISALSTQTPVIIVLSEDMIPCLFNEITLKNAKQIIVFSDQSLYSYPNFVHKKQLEDITLEYLKPFLPNLTIKRVEKQVEVKQADVEKNKKEEELKKKYKNFDWKFYVYFNPDLKVIENEPANELNSWRHFVNHGISERRIYSFDWVKYISDNNLQDIAHNKEEAFTHLVNNNNRDLYIRQTNFVDESDNYKLKMFDWQYYVSTHKDLHNINNYEDALNHYVQHGLREGRKISDFNWMDYLMMNRDLIDSGIVNEIQATRHWAQHGKQEGRKYRKQ
jgi:hypothetical protein